MLTSYIKKAVELNETGVKTPARVRPAAKKIIVPDYFLAALRKNKKALVTFQNFSPSHKREYVAWVTGAKKEETRARRMKTAIKQIAGGKSRNWKYK